MECHFDWHSKHHLRKKSKSVTWLELTHDNNDAKHDSNHNASCLTASLSTGIWIDWNFVGWNSWNWWLSWWRWRWKCFWCATLSLGWPTAFEFLTIVLSASSTTQWVELTFSAFTDTISVSSCPFGLLIFTICWWAMQATSLISTVGTSIWAQRCVDTAATCSIAHLPKS